MNLSVKDLPLSDFGSLCIVNSLRYFDPAKWKPTLPAPRKKSSCWRNWLSFLLFYRTSFLLKFSLSRAISLWAGWSRDEKKRGGTLKPK